MIVEADSEEVLKNFASRSVSLKWCIELWSRSKTYENLHKNLKSSLQNDINVNEIFEYSCIRKIMEPYFNKSFKVNVETFNKHFTLPEKVKKIEVTSNDINLVVGILIF